MDMSMGNSNTTNDSVHDDEQSQSNGSIDTNNMKSNESNKTQQSVPITVDFGYVSHFLLFIFRSFEFWS
jgi:hypothetical protein